MTGMNEKQIFKIVLLHCLVIVLSPILSFFLTKHFIFEEFFQMDSLQANIYSAVVAVITLHIALGHFIYRAYFSTETVPGFDKLQKED